MQATGIEWTDFSANPLKYRDKASGKTVWACVKHSPGCAHCYAETIALRYGRGGPFTKDSMSKVEPFLDEKELQQLLKSPKLTGKRVFIGDMTDVFGDWVPDALLDRLFAVFASRQDVTFQVLTKRADRLRDYLTQTSGKPYRENPWLPHIARAHAAMAEIHQYSKAHNPDAPYLKCHEWPLPNVWLGCSVENQEQADKRIPLLLQTPAAVRFLSCEPLIGPVDLQKICKQFCPQCRGAGEVVNSEDGGYLMGCPCERLSGLRWVIVGGESGPGARPCHVEWIRSIVEQCKATGVSVFCKQVGSNVVTSGRWPHESGDVTRPLTIPDGFGNCRIRLRDRKGGDPAEWPEDLRVRQFPEVAHA